MWEKKREWKKNYYAQNPLSLKTDGADGNDMLKLGCGEWS